jgi:hypothetical protein
VVLHDLRNKLGGSHVLQRPASSPLDPVR